MSFCEEQKRNFARLKCNVWIVPEPYKTPATDYPLEKVGSAELKRSYDHQNVYVMEGVNNSDFCCVENKIPITSLKINKTTWMVDIPSHWEGMKRLAEKSRGNVLVGGLGLGLVLHALRKNPKVKKIDVYERNKDVIKLMKDKIPKDITIHNENVFSFADERMWKKIKGEEVTDCPDTIILDTWVGKPDKKMFYEMVAAHGSFLFACPNSKVYIWGTRDPELNPAIEKEPCEVLKEMRV